MREHDFLTPLGASSGNFTSASNSAPSFSPASAISRQKGSSAGSAVTVGTASDAQTAAGSLSVTQVSGGSSTGISATSIGNSSGTISAVVTANCSATAGTLRFQASDGDLTGTGDLQVNLSNNDPPTLTYANANVNGGSGTTVAPATGPSDNGTINVLQVLSTGTFTGDVSVNGAGVVTISNAAPLGTHSITIRATDNCGAQTDASFQLTVDNTAPSFTPGTAIARQQGSAEGAAVTVGTVADAQTAAGSLSVSAISGGTASGLTISAISNSAGTVQASIAASCAASTGTQRFQVSDGALTGTGDLTVNVSANTAPILAYAATSVAGGGGSTLTPSSALTDNGSVDSVSVLSAGTYSGGISVDAAGVVTISNAAPLGTHSITIRATDNCGAQTDASFQLAVDNTAPSNTAPSITPANGLVREQGSLSSAPVLIANVADLETLAGSLEVTVESGGTASGVSISGLANQEGQVSGLISTSCDAIAGTLILRVSDGLASQTAELSIAVTANAAPVQGVYPNPSVTTANAASVISPSAAPVDNGSIEALSVASLSPRFDGNLGTPALTGVLNVIDAGSEGDYSISVSATDNCGAVGTSDFVLRVRSVSIFVGGFE